MKIGILALQGDFEKHKKAIKSLGNEPILVKTAKELRTVDGLIIPGGESTTFLKLIDKQSLRNDLIDFTKKKPVFGTCAGLIVMAKKCNNLPQQTLGTLDIVVERNAYGRQIDSFIDEIDLMLNAEKQKFEAVFIRAPKVLTINSKVSILGKHKTDVVIMRQDNILAATFHPELTDNPVINKYFIDMF